MVKLITLRVLEDKVPYVERATGKERRRKVHKPGAITIAYRVEQPDKDLPGKVKAGMMFSSPRGQFNRRMAQRIAKVRLATNPITIHLPTPEADQERIVFFVKSFLLIDHDWKRSRDEELQEGRWPAWFANIIGFEDTVLVQAHGIPKGDHVRREDQGQVERLVHGPRGWVFRCIPRWVPQFIGEL